MSTSVSATKRQAVDNSLTPSLPLIGEARNPLRGNENTPHHSTGDVRWMVPLYITAIERCMTRQQAAGLLGISEPSLSRKLNQQDGKCLNFQEFAALGERVAIAFHDELTGYFNLNDPQEQARVAAEEVTRGLSKLIALAVGGGR